MGFEAKDVSDVQAADAQVEKTWVADVEPVVQDTMDRLKNDPEYAGWAFVRYKDGSVFFVSPEQYTRKFGALSKT